MKKEENFNAKTQKNLATPQLVSSSMKEIYHRGHREHRGGKEAALFSSSSVLSVTSVVVNSPDSVVFQISG